MTRLRAAIGWLLEVAVMRLKGHHRNPPLVPRMADDFSASQSAKRGPSAGDPIPALTLYSLDESESRLDILWRERPALVVTASLTCVRARRTLGALMKLAECYSDRISVGVVYVIEAHPDGGPSPYTGRVKRLRRNRMAGIQCAQPEDLEKRIELAQRLKKSFKIFVPIFVDAMDNRAWREFGAMPNVGILVRPGGVVAVGQPQFDPPSMIEAIDALPQVSEEAKVKIGPLHKVSGM